MADSNREWFEREFPLDEPIQTNLKLRGALEIPCASGGSALPVTERVATAVEERGRELAEAIADELLDFCEDRSDPLAPMRREANLKALREDPELAAAFVENLTVDREPKPRVCGVLVAFTCSGCNEPLYPPPSGGDELMCWNRGCHFYEKRFLRPRLDVPRSVSVE